MGDWNDIPAPDRAEMPTCRECKHCVDGTCQSERALGFPHFDRVVDPNGPACDLFTKVVRLPSLPSNEK